MQDTIDILKQEKQREIELRKEVEQKSKDSFGVIASLEERL